MVAHPGDPRPPPPQIQEKCLPDELSNTESEGTMTGEKKQETKNRKDETSIGELCESDFDKQQTARRTGAGVERVRSAKAMITPATASDRRRRV